eukprot:Ihof_evm1s307 gene=Ihof_evmTU1s307
MTQLARSTHCLLVQTGRIATKKILQTTGQPNNNRVLRVLARGIVQSVHSAKAVKVVKAANSTKHRWIPAVLLLGGTLALNPIACKAGPESDSKLCLSVLNNHREAVERLLDGGYSVNQRHPLGWAPLHVAVVQGNIGMAKLLISKGADVNIEDHYSLNEPVGKSGYYNMLDVIRTRMVEFSRRVHPQNSTKGFTALHYAALLDNLELVTLLLDNGANPLAKNSEGHTPIEYVDVEGTANGNEIRSLLESAQINYEVKREEQEKEMRRRYPLEARIKERIVGQQGAINIVSSAIRRKENGWQDEDRPLVFLFLGSSGIGKTEMAKQLAHYLHGDKKECFVRLDMSEFQSKHEVAKFIGSPPGYVGHEEGGQLTEKLRACPNAVVLLDEVEKCHADVLTVMLQLFDEGRLTDGKGQTIECKDAIFIMTSNLAQDEIAEHGLQLREVAERERAALLANTPATNETKDSANDHQTMEVTRVFRDKVVRPILKSFFQRNEFLGRINEIIYFLPFSKDELKQLVDLELKHWGEKAKSRHGVELSWDNTIVTSLITGYDVHYGARSLKYEVDRRVINVIAALWESGSISRGCK